MANVSTKPEVLEWIRRRSDAVEQTYDTYDVLTENGIEIPDRNTDFQISCPFHGPDRRPSARYYGSSSKPHFHCYTCKFHAGPIDLYAKFKNVHFMDALKELERRFQIKVPRRPNYDEETKTRDKSTPNYKSDAWKDVPRVLEALEKKLIRIRDKVSMLDYVKFCRVLDAVQWDLKHNGDKQTPEMVQILDRLKMKMDESINVYRI
jgi:DNA primase